MDGLLKNKKKKENQDMQDVLNTLWKVGRLCANVYILINSSAGTQALSG